MKRLFYIARSKQSLYEIDMVQKLYDTMMCIRFGGYIFHEKLMPNSILYYLSTGYGECDRQLNSQTDIQIGR